MDAVLLKPNVNHLYLLIYAKLLMSLTVIVHTPSHKLYVTDFLTLFLEDGQKKSNLVVVTKFIISIIFFFHNSKIQKKKSKIQENVEN